MKNYLNKCLALAAILSLAAVSQVQAASLSLTMEYSSNPDFLADGGSYLQVTISDGHDGDIDFRVETQQDIQDISGAVPPSIYSFSFNFGNSGATVDNVEVSGYEVLGRPLLSVAASTLPASAGGISIYERWEEKSSRFQSSDAYRRISEKIPAERMSEIPGLQTQHPRHLNASSAGKPDAPGKPGSPDKPGSPTYSSAFGEFDVKLLEIAGGGVDPLLFSIVNVDGDTIYDYASSLSTGDAERFNTLFHAGIDGIKLCQFEASNLSGGGSGSCIDKSQFGGPVSVVPVPPAVALMFSGLAVIAGMGLRRRKSV
jgi:hypothetical protein